MADLARLGSKYAASAPGANTDIFATALAPHATASALRVGVCLTTASVFNMYVTNGTTAYTQGLNSSIALTAGDFFVFGPIPCSSTNTYNFRVETDSVIQTLTVDEIREGVV